MTKPIRANSNLGGSAQMPGSIEMLKSTVTGLQSAMIPLQAVIPAPFDQGSPSGGENVACREKAESQTVDRPCGWDGELIPVFTARIGWIEQLACNPGDLHGFLAVGWDFSNRIKKGITEYGFREDEDYSPILANRSDGETDKPRPGYHLTLGRANELAMVERNDQVCKLRKYFIECEGRAIGLAPQVPATASNAPPVSPAAFCEPVAEPFRDCGVHDAEFIAFLAVTRDRMGRGGGDQASIHTAKVLCWLWHHCLDEGCRYAGSRRLIARDLAMYHSTVLCCLMRLEGWGFIEQRMTESGMKCRLLRSVVLPELQRTKAFLVPNAARPLPMPRFGPNGLDPALPAGVDLQDLVNVAGSPAAVLFLARALEYQRQTTRQPGEYWFKGRAEREAETGLDRRGQESARRRLKLLGVLREECRGLPSRLWSRVYKLALTELIRARVQIESEHYDD